MTCYIDYYYLILECVLGAVIAATAIGDWSMTLDGPRIGRRASRVARVVMALAAFVGLVIVAIVRDGRVAFDRPGGRTISVRGLFNPLQIFWLLAACCGCGSGSAADLVRATGSTRASAARHS